MARRGVSVVLHDSVGRCAELLGRLAQQLQAMCALLSSLQGCLILDQHALQLAILALRHLRMQIVQQLLLCLQHLHKSGRVLTHMMSPSSLLPGGDGRDSSQWTEGKESDCGRVSTGYGEVCSCQMLMEESSV